MLKKLFDLKKKIVLITGIEGQLGKQIKKLYVSLGCKVYGIDLLKNKKSKTFIGDISDLSFVNKIIRKIIDKEKKIDIIINNAGKSFFTPFHKRTPVELKSTLDSNLIGMINIINTYYVAHKKYKLKNCNIVNISSIYGVVAPDLKIYNKKDNLNSEIYGATKAAVIQITKYYACALAKNNIIINSISPGGIKNKNHSKNFIKKYKKKVPMGRFGKENELFGALIYFSSEGSSYTTGQNLIIDGGFTSL